MVNLQNPEIPTPLQAIEIDSFVYDVQLKFQFNLDWLSHIYGRAYRHYQKNSNEVNYYPEVYYGTKKGVPQYYQPKPDNDKKGLCYFVIEKEKHNKFSQNEFNHISHNVGIVFWVNLDLISKVSLDTELITQHLIREVREVLTRRMLGTTYNLEILEVCREFSEIFKEYTHKEKENYLKAPYQAFRFNCSLSYQEDCLSLPIVREDIIRDNLTVGEAHTFIHGLDFTDTSNLGLFTPKQLADIRHLACEWSTEEF